MSRKLQCNKCKDIIESKHRHHWVPCSCGAIYIDGGSDYVRVGGLPADMTWIETTEEES